jgi:hypothetical protein
MAKQKTRPLDETIPGGSYMGADGALHDAHGNRIGDEPAAAPPVVPPVPPVPTEPAE